MPYTLCVVGCGTMGIAVLSGVLTNLNSPQSVPHPPQNTNGTSVLPSPADSLTLDPASDSVPNAYIATVAREESVRRLNKTFKNVPGGEAVQVQAGRNIEAVDKADVVLLWYACDLSHPLRPGAHLLTFGTRFSQFLLKLQTSDGAVDPGRRRDG